MVEEPRVAAVESYWRDEDGFRRWVAKGAVIPYWWPQDQEPEPVEPRGVQTSGPKSVEPEPEEVPAQAPSTPRRVQAPAPSTPRGRRKRDDG